jgi:hypothetical protein
MSEEDSADLVDFDAEGTLAAARGAAGEENVLIWVVYDDADFRTLYVDDRIDEMYPDEAARNEHFGRIHSYVHLEFPEKELFEDTFLEPDGVRAFVTYMGNLVAVRVVADKQGVFVSLAPDSPVSDVVDAVEGVPEP